MAYKQEHVGEIDLKTENHGELHIDAELDTLDMLTITFGNSFTLRVNEDSVDLLREMLYDVSRRMAIQRSKRDEAPKLGAWRPSHRNER